MLNLLKVRLVCKRVIARIPGNPKLNSAVAVLFVALLLPPIAGAQLQWFGYAGGGDDAMLDRTVTYINFGYFSTDENHRSTAAYYRINAMSQREMKAIVELGKLLWRPGADGRYQTLYPDYVDRWNTWKSTNAGALTSDKVLGFLVRDEPFLNKVNISNLEAASQMIKQDFPWAKIILVEAADAVYDPNPLSHFNQNRLRFNTVDWIGVDRYYIDPTSDFIFREAVTKLKQSYPGKKSVYVADGFWNQTHVNKLGSDINIMRNIMTKWYDVARNDPDAVLLGVFIWNSGGEITVGSDRFPPFVLDEHVRVGKAITGRTRTQLYQPVGAFEGYDSNLNAVGWACDPDSNWGEKVRVDFYEVGGGLLAATIADKPSEFFPQCRSGMAHRFRTSLGGVFGKKIIAFARDLDSGTAQLPSSCLDAPACTLYLNDNAPIGEFKISSTGFAEGWTCDADAPLASIKVEVWADSTAPNGTRVSTAFANLTSDETINGQCGGGTAHRFGVQLPSSTKGRAIFIYGIDTMQGSAFLLTAPDSGCQGVGVCIW
jgi:hypothetical protein